MALGVGLCNNGFMHHGKRPVPSAHLPGSVLEQKSWQGPWWLVHSTGRGN